MSKEWAVINRAIQRGRLDRFADRLKRGLVDGGVEYEGTKCLCWKGAVNNKGYAKLNFRLDNNEHVQVYAHRLFMALKIKGPIPEDKEVDHLCGVRRCVLHTQLITRAENATKANKSRARR
jgi:hypothetical protein